MRPRDAGTERSRPEHRRCDGGHRMRRATPPWGRPTALMWAAVVLSAFSAVTRADADTVGEGRVVVQKGIAGVRLGMTPVQVKTKVGLPRKVERGSSDSGSYVTYRYRTYSVTFFGGRRVTQMTTLSPDERTAAGIGVGSTRADVADSVPRTRCLRELSYDHCYVGVWKPGDVVTDFTLRNGRVARISIGYIVD
jgi:hypothetical protein